MSSSKKKDKIQKNREVGKPKIKFCKNSEKDSHDKSSRKVTQGLGQRIPDSKTHIVQLVERASWIEQAVQLALRQFDLLFYSFNRTTFGLILERGEVTTGTCWGIVFYRSEAGHYRVPVLHSDFCRKPLSDLEGAGVGENPSATEFATFHVWRSRVLCGAPGLLHLLNDNYTSCPLYYSST
ncbi:hypothetical protein DY000_02031619 [Brassica cretica]|uniref:Uncharacterized protein n=1 Tax=Brassica cretica TaxID=69181 RepID=A0ABQ7DSE9_BRACR|nr:hypothetical protein DY000_02031619 [Brassica cretica]